jgi:hypothetical protein
VKKRLHELVDFDELDALAKAHVEGIRYADAPHRKSAWRMVEVTIDCQVRRHGVTWTVTVRCRSAGSASRHLWFHGREMIDAVALAKAVLSGPFKGWRIYE